MSDSIKENNKLRTQQMGNMPASEMTKREQMALYILSGIFKNGSTNERGERLTYEEMVDNAVNISDLLIEKINSNL
jgi:hypothetical protein